MKGKGIMEMFVLFRFESAIIPSTFQYSGDQDTQTNTLACYFVWVWNTVSPREEQKRQVF
jgi:hypothetical protein